MAPIIEPQPLELPGRGARFRVAPRTDLLTLARELAAAIDLPPDHEYALIGHSLGAVLAFEVTRELRSRGHASPSHLFVVSRHGPRLRASGRPIHGFSDAALVGELQARYPGGIPEPVLREAELMDLLLPSLRADLEMLETYQYVEDEPLECPITAARGFHDTHTPFESLEAWGRETRGPLTIREYPGSHFFYRDKEPEVMDLVREQLGLPAETRAHP